MCDGRGLEGKFRSRRDRMHGHVVCHTGPFVFSIRSDTFFMKPSLIASLTADPKTCSTTADFDGRMIGIAGWMG